MTEFSVKSKDISTMVETLSELFQENGSEVKPKQLADRMAIKLNRRIHYSYVSYLLSSFGFITRPSPRHADRASRYIIPDDELLRKMQAEFNSCKSPAH